MSDFSGAVRRGFRSLSVFSGRDTPAQFWPFSGAVLGAAFIVGNVLFLVVAGASIATSSASAGTSDLAMPTFVFLIVVAAGVALLTVCLLAAAVTRRLHDRNHRGGWAGIPLVFLGAGLVMFGFVAKSFEHTTDPDPTLFLVNFANNVVYFVTLAVLLWQLIRSGSDGENRFGSAAPRT